MGKIDEAISLYNNIDRIRIIKNRSNIGKPASINKYFDYVGAGRWFITMDPDVIVPENGIDILIKQTNNLVNDGYPIAISCPAIVSDDNSWDLQIENKSMAMHYWSEMYEIEKNMYINQSLAGCLMLVSTEFFRSIGMYAANKLYNDDDGYICNKSVISNMINIINSNVKCIHDNSENEIGYEQWKIRNFNQQVDKNGYWD